jgi:hypothetical protein
MSLTDLMQSCNRIVQNSMEWNKMEGTGIMPECTVRERSKSCNISDSEEACHVIASPCIAWYGILVAVAQCSVSSVV